MELTHDCVQWAGFGINSAEALGSTTTASLVSQEQTTI